MFPSSTRRNARAVSMQALVLRNGIDRRGFDEAANSGNVSGMEQVKGVLIDLGGVVYQGGAAIRGSIDAVRRLKQAGMPVRFLTNTTSQPLSGILAKLVGLG